MSDLQTENDRLRVENVCLREAIRGDWPKEGSIADAMKKLQEAITETLNESTERCNSLRAENVQLKTQINESSLRCYTCLGPFDRSTEHDRLKAKNERLKEICGEKTSEIYKLRDENRQLRYGLEKPIGRYVSAPIPPGPGVLYSHCVSCDQVRKQVLAEVRERISSMVTAKDNILQIIDQLAKVGT